MAPLNEDCLLIGRMHALFGGLRNLQDVAQAGALYSAPRGVSVSGEPILRWSHLKSSSNF